MPARITAAEARRLGLTVDKPKKRRTKTTSGKSKSALLSILREWSVTHGQFEPVAEYKFHAERKWRFDFAWIGSRVSLEIEGGIWTQGRHTRGSGFIKDIDKYNSAVALSWKVMRCTPADVESGKVFEILQSVLRQP